MTAEEDSVLSYPILSTDSVKWRSQLLTRIHFYFTRPHLPCFLPLFLLPLVSLFFSFLPPSPPSFPPMQTLSHLLLFPSLLPSLSSLLDAFVPAGGRPNTINGDNWKEFLDSNGKPSSPLIVEGTNTNINIVQLYFHLQLILNPLQ